MIDLGKGRGAQLRAAISRRVPPPVPRRSSTPPLRSAAAQRATEADRREWRRGRGREKAPARWRRTDARRCRSGSIALVATWPWVARLRRRDDADSAHVAGVANLRVVEH